MKPGIHNAPSEQTAKTLKALFGAVVFAGMLAVPDLALAEGSFGGAEDKVENFFSSINSLLNVASIAVVTIAVIFAGYQIAFAHKRISDVAPVLIGGFLIGAAAQIAKMLMGDDSTLPAAGMLLQALPLLHA